MTIISNFRAAIFASSGVAAGPGGRHNDRADVSGVNKDRSQARMCLASQQILFKGVLHETVNTMAGQTDVVIEPLL